MAINCSSCLNSDGVNFDCGKGLTGEQLDSLVESHSNEYNSMIAGGESHCNACGRVAYHWTCRMGKNPNVQLSALRSATGAYRGQTGTPVNHQTCGCTESVALNFDNDAYYDDGSCQFTEGCTFQHASNYDPNACWDNGTCTGFDESINWADYTSTYTFYWAEVAGRNCCANLDIYDAKTEWGGNQCGGYIDWETTEGPLCADLPPEISNVKKPKKPLYQSGMSKMRMATGGGKRSVGTAVNWLTSLI